ncbi:twin-arginine translocation signal domain-containing protein [Streptomyces sp. NPDC049541]
MNVSRRRFLTTATALGSAVLLAPPGAARAISGGIPDYRPTRASLDTHR